MASREPFLTRIRKGSKAKSGWRVASAILIGTVYILSFLLKADLYHTAIMLISASMLIFGCAFAQHNQIFQTQNLSVWPSSEPNLPPFRVIVTIFLDEVIHPRLVTLSGLPKVTTESRHIVNAPTRGSHNYSAPLISVPQSNRKLNPLPSLYMATGAASYKSWKLPSQSISAVNTSRGMILEFTSSATLSKLYISHTILIAITSISAVIEIVI